MAERDKEQLDRKFDSLSAQLPSGLRRWVEWLRDPSSRLFRIPLGVLLVFFGFLGFLPILGFWMVPLGVLLLAQDIPFLQRPTRVAINWVQRRWAQWKRRKG